MSAQSAVSKIASPRPAQRAEGTQGPPTQLKQSLRGQDYATQVQLLAPGGPSDPAGKAEAPTAAPEVVTAGKDVEAKAGTTAEVAPQEGPAAAAPEAATEEVEVPEVLNKKNVSAYLNERFANEIQSQGLFETFFSLSVEVKNKSKLDKGATEATNIGEVWSSVGAALTAHTGDVRTFSVRAAVKTTLPGKGKKPPKDQYVHIRVGLNRRPVSEKENADIESSLMPVDAAYGYSGASSHRLAPETYEAYQRFYASIPAEFTARDANYGKIMSSYRSSETQRKKYNGKVEAYVANGMDRKEAEKVVRKAIAAPGSSAHETGHGIDIWVGCPIKTSVAGQMKNPKSKMYKQHHDFFEWVAQNAPAAGFLPYAAEPWHWEKWR